MWIPSNAFRTSSYLALVQSEVGNHRSLPHEGSIPFLKSGRCLTEEPGTIPMKTAFMANPVLRRGGRLGGGACSRCFGQGHVLHLGEFTAQQILLALIHNLRLERQWYMWKVFAHQPTAFWACEQRSYSSHPCTLWDRDDAISPSCAYSPMSLSISCQHVQMAHYYCVETLQSNTNCQALNESRLEHTQAP